MRKLLIAVVLTSWFLMACGPDSELVASGKNHKCKVMDLAKKMAATPADKAVQAQFKESSANLASVIDSAGEGDKAALEKAIDEAVAKGCK